MDLIWGMGDIRCVWRRAVKGIRAVWIGGNDMPLPLQMVTVRKFTREIRYLFETYFQSIDIVFNSISLIVHNTELILGSFRESAN
jgi:hypothetical protein